MALRKQAITHNGATSKSKSISTIAGTVPLPTDDQSRTTEKLVPPHLRN